MGEACSGDLGLWWRSTRVRLVSGCYRGRHFDQGRGDGVGMAWVLVVRGSRLGQWQRVATFQSTIDFSRRLAEMGLEGFQRSGSEG